MAYALLWLAGWLFLLVLMASFVLWLQLQKFRRKLIHQLPGYIDAMVRLITIGNSTQAAFQLAIATTQAPLRGHLERAAALVRAGVDLDRALHQTAENVRIEEMYLLASILGLGVRYGGRADLLLERVAKVAANLRNGFLLRLDTPSAIAGELAQVAAVTGGITAVDEMYTTLSRVTPETVQAAAKKLFDSRRRTVATLREKK